MLKIFVAVAIHADLAHEEVTEQDLHSMHGIILELFKFAESLAAEICFGDLHSIEWLLHGLFDLAEPRVIALIRTDLSFDNSSNFFQRAVSHDGQLLRTMTKMPSVKMA